MIHDKCLEKIKIIEELKNKFLIGNYNNWGSRVDQEVRSAIDVFCKLLIKELK